MPDVGQYSYRFRHSRDFHFHSKNKPAQKEGKGKKDPGEWGTIFFKAYPRLPKLPLQSHIKSPAGSLAKSLARRTSRRDFNGKPLSTQQLATLLWWSGGIRETHDKSQIENWNLTRRPYPSAGGRYPLEIYPLVLSGNRGVPRGLYHYNLRDNSLEILLPGADLIKPSRLFTFPWVAKGSAVLLITAIFWRNTNKYGERGYRHVLMEAGHLAQNISLVAEALGLKCCVLSGFIDEEVEKLLDVDGEEESMVTAVVIGP